MKTLRRLLLLGLVLAGLARLPFRGVDLAKLIPVKTVIVTRSGDSYAVDVGAGVRGVGKTLSGALADLRASVSGEIFFPTAEQVIVAGPDPEPLETVRAVAEEPAFRPAAAVYLSPESELDPASVEAYLHNRTAEATVMAVRADLRAARQPRIPLLLAHNGGYRIAEPESR